MASSSSHGILGQKLLDGKTKTIYAAIDQPRLVCIQQKDYPNALVNRRMSIDYTFRFNNLQQTRAGTEITPKGVLMTSITTSVYEILREASIPTFYVASHPQPDMFIAQKCTMIPMSWMIRRLADENYVKRHPGFVNGHRFTPPLIEVYYKRHTMINRRLALGTLDDNLEIDRENQTGQDEEEEDSEELVSSIWSYEQLLSTSFKHENLKLSQTDLEYMYEMSCAVFDILEHVWMVEKNCQLIDLKLEFGITTTTTTTAKEIVLANTFDVETWHILQSMQTAAPNGNDLAQENLNWMNNCLRDILNLNINSSLNVKTVPEDEEQDSATIPEDEEVKPENVLNIAWTSFSLSIRSRCVIVCASSLDIEHGQKIKNSLNEVYDIECDIRLYSISKSTHTILRFLSKYTYEHCRPTVFVTLGNINNGLAMCLSSNSQYPVIHCSLIEKDLQNHVVDMSSLTSNDTSLFTVVFTLSSAIQNVAQILASNDWKLWTKQRGRRLRKYMDLIIADLQLTRTQTTKINSGLLINR